MPKQMEAMAVAWSTTTSTAFLPLPKPCLPPPHRSRVRVRVSSSPTDADELAAPLLPNARRRERDPLWCGGFSLGVDLGGARTGLAVGKGITRPRPLTVLQLRGQKLELRLLEIAQQEEVDELIVGLPVSSDGNETAQSNKVRSIVGRLAVQAAERGLRVYLQDEHGTSIDALNFMISKGVKRSARDVKSDAYSAMMILERYFSSSGHRAEIILPKQPELQEKLTSRRRRDAEKYEDTSSADLSL